MDEFLQKLRRQASTGDEDAVAELERWAERLDPTLAKAKELLYEYLVEYPGRAPAPITLEQIAFVASVVKQRPTLTKREAQWLILHYESLKGFEFTQPDKCVWEDYASSED